MDKLDIDEFLAGNQLNELIRGTDDVDCGCGPTKTLSFSPINSDF